MEGLLLKVQRYVGREESSGEKDKRKLNLIMGRNSM